MVVVRDADDDTVEEAGSLVGWTNLIEERFVPLRIRPHDADDDVRGSVSSRQVGPLQAATVRSVPMTFRRTDRQAAAAEADVLAVGLVDEGTGVLEQDGRRCVVADGGFAVYDTTRPFRWTFDGPWQMHVYTWPRAGLAVPDPQLTVVTARTVRPGSALGELVSPMLRRLSTTSTAGLSAPTASRLADEVAELALLAAGEDVGPGGRETPADDDLFHRVAAVVDDNLGDAQLGAEMIAHELFVSTRTLHRAFARHDLTLSAWIKARRLDACRRMLCSPASERTPIHAVASRHGFTNPSFFSREFAARFGMTPRECRRR